MTTPTSTSLNTLVKLTSCAQMVKTFYYSKIYHYILLKKKPNFMYLMNWKSYFGLISIEKTQSKYIDRQVSKYVKRITQILNKYWPDVHTKIIFSECFLANFWSVPFVFLKVQIDGWVISTFPYRYRKIY